MVKVESGKTLRMLTRQFIKKSRGRNAAAVAAIILTTLLFTTLFTGVLSMFLTRMEADKKQYMVYSHAYIQELTAAEGKAVETLLENSGFVKRFGSAEKVGEVCGGRFPFPVEVRSGDLTAAEGFGCVPSHGRLPQNPGEIAVSTRILESLGLSGELGEKIELPIRWEKGEADGEKPDGEEGTVTTFRLCGYWEGDKTAKTQFALVSESGEEGGPQGMRKSFFVWYKHPWRMREYTDRLAEEAAGLSLEKGIFHLNIAYDRIVGEGGISLSSLAALIFLILLSGYLTIYNIFNISIRNDMYIYGLLKSAGTTGRQLRRMVRMQTWRLSAVGIPAGLLLGYGAGVGMIPVLNVTLERRSGMLPVYPDIPAVPWIFLTSALFAFVTVYLSSLRACRIVGEVSPVEALRMAETGRTGTEGLPGAGEGLSGAGRRPGAGEGLSGAGRRPGAGEGLPGAGRRPGAGEGLSGAGRRPEADKKRKESGWAVGYQLGMRNVLQNRRKGLLVMISMGIFLVTVNCMVIMAGGYRLEPYVDIYLNTDFQLDKLGVTAEYADVDGISEEVKKVLGECSYSRDTGYLYYSREEHETEKELQETWRRIIERYGESWGVYWQQVWRASEAAGQIPVECIGIDRFVFERLEWEGTPGTWEEFCSGKYMIAEKPYYLEEGDHFYQAGNCFSLRYGSGISRTYQVLGEARLPYSFDYPYVTLVSVKIFVPEEEFIACTGKTSAMRAVMNAKEGQERALQQYLEQRVLAEDGSMNLDSVLDIEENFQEFVDKYYRIGGWLTAILALIGIMNFFNVTVTSVLSRKRELFMLRAVGMTKKQIWSMLTLEGGVYLGGAMVLAVVFTHICAGTLLKKTLGTAFFFEMQVTAVPSLLMLPLLALLAWAIPGLSLWYLRQERRGLLPQKEL